MAAKNFQEHIEGGLDNVDKTLGPLGKLLNLINRPVWGAIFMAAATTSTPANANQDTPPAPDLTIASDKAPRIITTEDIIKSIKCRTFDECSAPLLSKAAESNNNVNNITTRDITKSIERNLFDRPTAEPK